VPQAGSTITSRGVGSVIATISSMMWRGVRTGQLRRERPELGLLVTIR
jgi:hypothetical protein